jgi:hypothetical protein
MALSDVPVDRRDQPWFGRERQWLYRVASDLESPTDGAAMEALTEIDGHVTVFREGPAGSIAMTGRLYSERVLSYEQPALLIAEPGPGSNGKKPGAFGPAHRPGSRLSFRRRALGGPAPAAGRRRPAARLLCERRTRAGDDGEHGSALLVSADVASGEGRRADARGPRPDRRNRERRRRALGAHDRRLERGPAIFTCWTPRPGRSPGCAV